MFSLTNVMADVSAFDFTSIDTSAVIPTLLAGIGVVSGIAITGILIRKGYNMVKSAIRKA